MFNAIIAMKGSQVITTALAATNPLLLVFGVAAVTYAVIDSLSPDC